MLVDEDNFETGLRESVWIFEEILGLFLVEDILEFVVGLVFVEENFEAELGLANVCGIFL